MEIDTSVGTIIVKVGRLAWIFATSDDAARFDELPESERTALRSEFEAVRSTI